MTETNRKQAHIDICLEQSVERGQTGYDAFRLLPESLPEMAISDALTSTFFLGKRLSLPFIIASMSGGVGGQFKLNHRLARAAQKAGVALALGSLRPAVENVSYLGEYDVRNIAPDIPLLGNIAAWQLRDVSFRNRLLETVARLRLDGIFVHTNVAQELLQPEGERDFDNVVAPLLAFITRSSVPVFVKEVGGGFSSAHLPRLLRAGLTGIDVAGSGGTDWVTVEALRSPTPEALLIARDLNRLALPTANAIRDIRAQLKTLPNDLGAVCVIGSGGVRSAHDMAIALGLGADLVSAALPVLKAAYQGDAALDQLLAYYQRGLRHLMVACGARDLARLRSRIMPNS
jgi:isopentenyl-diphosphate delta-isomerase